MSSESELITQFKDVTGTLDDERARFYLESSNWALQEAITSFFENPPDTEIIAQEDNLPEPAFNTNDEITPNYPATTNMSEGEASDSSNFQSSAKPRIATLHNTSQRSSDDEEEGQAFYAGGSERSGQQVLGPPKRKNFREQLTDMFKMAHGHGAVIDSPSTSNSRGESNWGIGLRLGQTEDDHSEVSGSERPTRPQTIEPVILKLWNQGFSINDGDLRPYDDSENKVFLETVMRGRVPNELREMGNMVSVDVEDHRHEDYKKPASKIKTFKGSGHTLGSPAPNVEGTFSTIPTTMESTSNNENEENDKRATEQLNTNLNEPTTLLQIRLADGSRISTQFNLSHTISDIRQYIITSRPQYGNQNFILVTAFPTKELTNESETIDNAGLKNVTIMQRLK